MKIGDVVQKVALARFSRSLSTLVAAGVDIISALEITGTTAGNYVIEESLADVRTQVHEGARISDPLIEDPIFPPMVGQMIKIGEETGELDKMLGKIAEWRCRSAQVGDCPASSPRGQRPSPHPGVAAMWTIDDIQAS